MSQTKNQHFTLSERQLYDLELIMNGAFSPINGFLNKEDYESVVENHRLTNGKLWPIPIVFDIDNKDIPKIGSSLILEDVKGNELARLSVESTFVPDKRKEALNVYGTVDKTHPGVKYLFDQTKEIYVGGKISPLNNHSHQDFLHLRKGPAELRNFFKEKSLKNILFFQTRNPIHRAHYELVVRTAKEHGLHIHIHPAVGPTKDGDIDYATRVRSYEKLIAVRMPHTTLSLFPLAMRMAGPREALWHAIIRKNYGATHFIIGRDHAGPGKDINGISFYGPYDAQKFVKEYESEIGIVIIQLQELVYDDTTKTYMSLDKANSDSKITSISGTEFRRMLRVGENIPEWFSFPEVIDELRKSVNA